MDGLESWTETARCIGRSVIVEDSGAETNEEGQVDGEADPNLVRDCIFNRGEEESMVVGGAGRRRIRGEMWWVMVAWGLLRILNPE